MLGNNYESTVSQIARSEEGAHFLSGTGKTQSWQQEVST